MVSKTARQYWSELKDEHPDVFIGAAALDATHGGVSLEEVIIPFIELKGKK